MLEEATACVQEGARYLDGIIPDWYDRVDLETLNVECPNNCVFAQVGNGEFDETLEKLGLNLLDATRFGAFVLNPLPDEDFREAYRFRTILFKEEILHRREMNQTPVYKRAA